MEITIKLTATPELCRALDSLAKLIGATEEIKPGAVNAQATTQATMPVTQTPASMVPAVPVAPVQNPTPHTAPVAPPAPTVPVAGAPSYTIDQLAVAGAALVDAGKMEQLLALLAKYGVAAVTQLRPEQFGAFATELRALGAQI